MAAMIAEDMFPEEGFEMRVLLTTWAWPSHLYALVPFGWACRNAGHEVVVASQPALLPEIGKTGLTGVGIGSDVDAVSMVRSYLPPKPDQRSTATAQPGAKGPRALEMVLAHASSMVHELVDLARDWRADVIVYEPTALAGPIASAANGIPAVRHLYGPDLMYRARSFLPDALRPLAEQHGVGEFNPLGAATIDPTPGSVQVPTDYRRFPMRYTPFAGAMSFVEPQPSTTRPRVCLTWGHTIGKVDPDRFPIRWLADVLAPTGIELVAAVSSAQKPMMTGVEADIDLVVDGSLQHMMPSCDLVVSHGGAATSLTALSNGVPLLVMPDLPDHTGHAGRLAESGAGEMIPAAEATEHNVRATVGRLLDQPQARARAREVREEIRMQPSPSDVVAETETLVRDWQRAR